MPLSLAKCGTLGGDVEMAAVVKTLALRNPEDTFVLVGRNSGEKPRDVGLPENVENPWADRNLAATLREEVNARGFNRGNLSPEDQLTLQAQVFDVHTLPMFEDLDALVLWLGQHGTSNSPIPSIKDRSVLTKPQDWCAYYSGWIFNAVNRWRDANPWRYEEIYINADSRNKLKLRDLKWPLRHPVLSQFNFEHQLKHERYGDRSRVHTWDEKRYDETFNILDRSNPDVWVSRVHNVYSRLEINALVPGTPFGDLMSYDEEWSGRQHFGMFINEARAYVGEAVARKTALREYALPLDPAFIHGTWSKASLSELGVNITPAPWEDYYPRLHSVRCTLTTPSSGSGWATTKPWEAFAGGTVCFFHPRYDTQDHILGDADPQLREFLRVDSPETLARRVKALDTDPVAWLWLVRKQREHYEKAIEELTYAKMIEQRLGKDVTV